MKSIVFAMRLDDTTARYLDRLAEVEGESRAFVVRSLIREKVRELESHQVVQPARAAEVYREQPVA